MKVTYQKLLSQINDRAYSHLNSYLPSFDGDLYTFSDLMNMYIQAKVFETSFVDLVPKIISDVLCIRIKVHTEDGASRNIQPEVVKPQTGIINLLFSGEHYQALAPPTCRPAKNCYPMN